MQALTLDLLYLEAIQTAKHVNLTPVRLSEINEQFRWTAADIRDSMAANQGYLPTDDMAKGLGFNMRVRSVPA